MKSLLRSYYHNLSGLKTPKDWLPYSNLLIRSSNSDWVLDTIGKEMLDVCSDINIPTINNRYAYKLKRQSIFYTSKYDIMLSVSSWISRNCIYSCVFQFFPNVFFAPSAPTVVPYIGHASISAFPRSPRRNIYKHIV